MIASPNYVEYWQTRIKQQQEQDQQLAKQVKMDLAAIVKVLVQQFGVTHIILFGSLAKGTFKEDSDIDLAVAGIPARQFFAALGAINSQSRVWVDLKPLEDLEPHFRQCVLATGECLYESVIDQPTTGFENRD
ncbi:MAG: DNA polymerase subunit beta [Thiotrichaceae bacterium IS1]|nr:MAG: DNA polymerase subunit beta [Thiotrichaceae bacterium IS1]